MLLSSFLDRLNMDGFVSYHSLRVGVFWSRTGNEKKDAQDIAEGYEENGIVSLQSAMKGASFILVDLEKRWAFVARDMAGCMPVFVRHSGGRFAVSETVGALFQPGEIPAVSLQGCIQYLTFQYLPAPHTLVREVEKLHPGELREYDLDNNSLRERQIFPSLYFASARDDMPPLPELFASVYGGIVDLLSEKIGALSSGGIDSTTNILWLRELGCRPILLTAGFENAHFDETPFVEALSRHLALELRLLRIEPQRISELAGLAEFLSEPICDRALLPTSLLLKKAASSLRGILSGEGGDELWGPPRRWPPSWALGDPAISLPDLASCYLEAAACTSLETRFAIFSSSHKDVVEEQHHCSRDLLAEAMARANPVDNFQAVKAAQVATWLPENVMAKDRAAAKACGTNMYFPLANPLFFAFIGSLPPCEHLAGCSSKELLRQFHRGKVPDMVFTKTKHKFKVPSDLWLTADLLRRI